MKEDAVKKLGEELNDKTAKWSAKAWAVKGAVHDALVGFCNQNPEFAQAVAQSDKTLSAVCEECVKNVGRRRFPISKIERDFTLPLADFMSGWIERFIGGQDRERTAEQHGRLRRLREEYDVDLTPVSEQEREELEAGQIETVAKPFRADAPTPIREAPEAFRKILEDVRSGRGTGLFPGRET